VRERWFGATGRRVPEIALESEFDTGDALVLDKVDDAALREAHAEGRPVVVRAATAEAVKSALDQCGTDLASDLVDNGLVLAGGGALLRGLDRFLSQQTGLPTRVCADPLLAVARGTYICLEHFDRWRSAMQSGDDDV